MIRIIHEHHVDAHRHFERPLVEKSLPWNDSYKDVSTEFILSAAEGLDVTDCGARDDEHRSHGQGK